VLLVASCSSPATVGPDARPGVDAAAPDPNAPPPSAGHALVFAGDLGRVLLVNAGLGAASPPPTTPTRIWSWSGSRWELIDATGPPIRNLAGVAHDGTRLVMHGGTYSAELSYGETWVWTSAGGWRRLPGENPGVRDHTRMVWHEQERAMVLFGGQNGASFPSDTWSLEGDTWRRDDVPGPPPRVHHAMEYQASGSRVLVFGGNDLDGDTLGDTWSWNGTAWTQLGRPITPRSHAIMAGNPERGVLLLGGFQPSLAVLRFTETDSWTPLGIQPEPPARYLAAAAPDPTRNVTVLFGGGDPQSSDLHADTWELGATTWTRR